MTFLKEKKNIAYMWVLTDKFYKSSPNSKYRVNFLSAPMAIYSRVSATLHGCQRPKMWRLFLRAMLPVYPPSVQCLLHSLAQFRSVICTPSTYGKQTFGQIWGYLSNNVFQFWWEEVMWHVHTTTANTDPCSVYLKKKEKKAATISGQTKNSCYF